MVYVKSFMDYQTQRSMSLSMKLGVVVSLMNLSDMSARHVAGKKKEN